MTKKQIADRRIKMKRLRSYITCSICNGYLVNATSITECLHTFCKTCLVKYLEDNNTCPTCDLLIHQSHPLKYISLDPSIQDIVYKLVPGLQDTEEERERKFCENRCLQLPKHLQSNEEGSDDKVKQAAKDAATDYHRNDEPLVICLESASSYLDELDDKYILLSSQAPVNSLKKYIAFKLYSDVQRYNEIAILCNGERLGKDHTLKFVQLTMWVTPLRPILLQYSLQDGW